MVNPVNPSSPMLRYLILSLILVSTLSAQTSSTSALLYGGPLSELIDAQSIALGESAVAKARHVGGWNSNPATVAGVKGIGIGFGKRNIPWLGSGVPGFYSVGGWMGTPVGDVAINYSVLDLGEFQQTFENGMPGGTFRSYEDLISLTYATTLTAPVSLGASLKRFVSHTASVIGATQQSANSNPGVWFDFGAIYTHDDLFSSDNLHDTIHLGASIQNIGGKINYVDISQADALAQWLRLGINYTIAFQDSLVTPLRLSLSAEYRRLLNAGGTYLEDRSTDIGTGLEATIFDIFSARLGTAVLGADTHYGSSSELTFRYGLGINVSLSQFRSDIPLSFALDYAAIPTRATYTNDRADNVQSVNLRVAYMVDLFR